MDTNKWWDQRTLALALRVYTHCDSASAIFHVSVSDPLAVSCISACEIWFSTHLVTTRT